MAGQAVSGFAANYATHKTFYPRERDSVSMVRSHHFL